MTSNAVAGQQDTDRHAADQYTADQHTTVGSLRAAVHQFVSERDWYRYHSPKNLAMSIAIESAEIMEHFQWLSNEEAAARMENPAQRAEVADELADVLIYCLSFANSSGIDLSQAILTKLARNQVRFPVERVRGRLGDGEQPLNESHRVKGIE